MADLLIRNLDPELKRKLQERARAHKRSLSEEAQQLLNDAVKIKKPKPAVGLGTYMASLIPPEYRGDDLVFEVPGGLSEPPDFE